MKQILSRSTVLAVILFAAQLSSIGQASAVEERNVRAGMVFLAGDALQGRGSGTQYERITAEYVGSQFMQFGLEPAGEIGFDGNAGFVQTVNVSRAVIAGNPTVSFGSTSLTHGGEMVVLRTNSAKASGPLQRISIGGKPNPGAAAFLTVNETDEPRAVQQAMQGLAAAGASIVIVPENAQWRQSWPTFAARRLGFRVVPSATPSVLVVVSKTAADELARATEGTEIKFQGSLDPVATTQTWNAIGKISGSDPATASELVVLSSHLDHLGVRENAPGEDKIFNGADDDASGTVAVMELARVLAAGKRPKRTVYFVCYGSEEAGGYGSGHFVNNLPFPKEKLIANLQWEMIGRPDAKVGADELWLTGYERSNLGPELVRRGAKLVADPHPSENFFQRSDNYTLARQGIIAHTVSSFGLHTDYHRASDELRTIDFSHMTRSINSMIKPIVWLLNSDFKPQWVEGKRP